jgi:hypothetical protein
MGYLGRGFKLLPVKLVRVGQRYGPYLWFLQWLKTLGEGYSRSWELWRIAWKGKGTRNASELIFCKSFYSIPGTRQILVCRLTLLTVGNFTSWCFSCISVQEQMCICAMVGSSCSVIEECMEKDTGHYIAVQSLVFWHRIRKVWPLFPHRNSYSKCCLRFTVHL